MAGMEKGARRILTFLARGAATVRPAAGSGRVLLDGGERGVVGAERNQLGDVARARRVTLVGAGVTL
jgi:hypothetical protein